jgi:transcriptional regulator with XRE-family HTH domain
VAAYRGSVANEDLGRTLRRLRRLASLTQEELAERSNVSVDVIRQLEQGRKHSARLPTLHALANGLGVELTTLLGDPPAVSSTGENDGPRFVAVRRAIMPVLRSPEPEPPGPGFSLDRLREQIADGWTQYHAAEFDTARDRHGRARRRCPGAAAGVGAGAVDFGAAGAPDCCDTARGDAATAVEKSSTCRGHT